jgi:hypothetical protein
MRSMPEGQGVASGQTLSAGAALVFGAGLALYQLTSLVLGPVGSRQLDLSLTIPAVEVQDFSESMASNIKVVGARTTPYAPASGAARISRSSRASSTPTPGRSGHQLPIVARKPEPTVIPKPAPTAAPKPEPAVVPTPESHPDASQLNEND